MPTLSRRERLRRSLELPNELSVMSKVSAPNHLMPYDPAEWREPVATWLESKCVRNRRCYSGVRCLHRAYIDWELSHGDVPCPIDEFERLIQKSGFLIVDAMATGLILQTDLDGVRRYPEINRVLADDGHSKSDGDMLGMAPATRQRLWHHRQGRAALHGAPDRPLQRHRAETPGRYGLRRREPPAREMPTLSISNSSGNSRLCVSGCNYPGYLVIVKGGMVSPSPLHLGGGDNYVKSLTESIREAVKMTAQRIVLIGKHDRPVHAVGSNARRSLK
jgi:hypothetical protein